MPNSPKLAPSVPLHYEAGSLYNPRFVSLHDMKIDPRTFTLKKRPAFIVFEGINGCGKTTLHKLVSQSLRSQNTPLVDTREPGGTALGKEIRKLVLEWSGEKKSELAELLLFAADRAEHVDKVIMPALTSGSSVLCDRFIYSTITFQGHGRGVKRQWLDQANLLATRGLEPDLVILLDLEPRTALERISKRVDNGRDSFEDEHLEFHGRIREGFLECAELSPVPFLVLDATQSPEELLRHTCSVLGAR